MRSRWTSSGRCGEHRQRLDLAAVGEAVAGVAVQLLRHVAGLHGDDTHAVVAVQRFRGDGERRDIAFVPIEDEQIFRAMLRGRDAGLGGHPHIGIGRQRDGALERRVHRRDAERRCRQHQRVHVLGDRVRDHVGGECVGAGRQMRAVLLDAAAGQDHGRVLFELRRDFRLGEVEEIAARQHGGLAHRAFLWASAITSARRTARPRCSIERSAA